LAVNDRKYKEIQDWLCYVLTHFVDFHIKFTLRQWMGRVKRTHIILQSFVKLGARAPQCLTESAPLMPITLNAVSYLNA